MSDIEALTAAAADGDREAIEQLLEHYMPELRAFVRLRSGRMLRARESSSDLVQSVCRQILQQADRFRHPSEGAFRRWLFTTALRKISHRAEYWRAERRDAGREVAVDAGQVDGEEDSLLGTYRGFVSPSRALAVKEEVERIEGAFDQLEERDRELIVEAHLLGTPRAELAERMGKTEGAVRVQLHRALARLSALLATDED